MALKMRKKIPNGEPVSVLFLEMRTKRLLKIPKFLGDLVFSVKDPEEDLFQLGWPYSSCSHGSNLNQTKRWRLLPRQ
jgi:hypothetical protein